MQSLLAVEVKKIRKIFHSTADVRVTPFMSTTADVDTAIVNDFFLILTTAVPLTGVRPDICSNLILCLDAIHIGCVSF